MTNDLAHLILPPCGDDAQAEAFRADTLSLLTERAARYTMGDSTSVPIETAERLLSGILYCIRLHLDTSPDDAGARPSPRALYEAGIRDAKKTQKRCLLLLRQAELAPPPVENAGYLDTLAAIRSYLRYYDAENFADEIPADIVYPLACPVPETLRGPSYAAAYLRGLLCENALLRRFPRETLSPLLTRCYGDYIGLLVNLYTPVAEACAGRALAGLPPDPLFLPRNARQAVLLRLRQAEEAEARRLLIDAAEAACAALGLVGARERAYLADCALSLLPRIRACAEINEADGIFPVSYAEGR